MRQKASHKQFRHVDGREQSHFTKGVTSHQGCYGRF
ncbi:hypothetical protein [Nostoc sp.]